MNEIFVAIGDKKKVVKIVGNSKIILDGKENEYELFSLDSKSFLLNFNKKVYKVSSSKIENDKITILIDGFPFECVVRTALEEKADAIIQQKTVIKHRTEVKAPMPGMILKIKKSPGEKITQGETIIILEAMKMENDLRSPASGVMKEIFVLPGNTVEKGAMLFSIE
ncbi:MAG: biotin/lipoyl-containing protein [Ignavibacteriaceae bacterium]